MKCWNVVVCAYQEGFKHALSVLRELGPVERSPYHNVLLMTVDDPLAVLDRLEQRAKTEPVVYDVISRVAPAMRRFEFHSVEEFRDCARSIATEWLPRLAGRSFHVRIRRRGFGQVLTCQTEERWLAEAILAALQAAGTPGTIRFDDSDAVLTIDTVDDQAGMALRTRDDLACYSLLRPD